MIKPDIIVSWPRNCDYPLWRQYIHDFRDRFAQVIIVFTETHYGEDYRESVRAMMVNDLITFVDPQKIGSGEDWRNVAIHAGLKLSSSDWILFTEQDFLPNDPLVFWDSGEIASPFEDAYVVKDDQRIHPCFILMKRSALQRTQQEFGIVPDKLDHFGLFQKDLEDENRGIKIMVISNNVYTHMNGLSQNMTLIYNKMVPNWKPTIFTQYIVDCLKVSVPLDPRFVQLANEYLSDPRTLPACRNNAVINN